MYMCLGLTIYNWITCGEARYIPLEKKWTCPLLKVLVPIDLHLLVKPCKITPSTLAHIDVVIVQFLFRQPYS